MATTSGLENRSFRTLRAGTLSYIDGLALQYRLLKERRLQTADILTLLQHPPVMTMGRNSSLDNLLLPAIEFERLGLQRIAVARGGDITFHGPGQLVGYPIVDLKPLGRHVRGFLRKLEEVLIDLLQAFDIVGMRVEGKTGVWVGDEKIASIGIGVKQWISWHGFALNVSVDLNYFSMINPCGLQGIRMTSMEKILGHRVSMARVEWQLTQSFSKVFQSQYLGEYEFATAAEAELA